MLNNNIKHYIVYKTTNKLNHKIYIGIHETFNLNDTYLGSGVILNRSISIHGKENFTKEILYIFDNKQDMLNKECELVNEKFIKRKDTYNCIVGGILNTSGFANVKDKDGNMFLVDIDDQRYLSGELVGITTGFVNCIDENGNTSQVSQEEFDNSPNLKGITNGMVAVKDKDGIVLHIKTTDPRYLSGELKSTQHNTTTVKTEGGKFINISIDSEEYKNGNYTGTFKNKKHSEKTKNYLSCIKKGIYKGCENSQYNSCWIYNNKENKKIKKLDLDIYLNDGWLLGRNSKLISNSNKISDETIKEMISHHLNKLSNPQISKIMDLHINTIFKYVKRYKDNLL